ncbi:MAG: 1-acyl-sn-glycerol-3-phosphate acyltransferase [Bryobacteraceae bacterium]
MKVALRGFTGPVARATRERLDARGHQLVEAGAECLIYFPRPGDDILEGLERAAGTPGLRRLVLRSHAYAYGSSTKNPGLITEERVSLLPDDAPERRWLRAEEIVARFPNSAAVRLTNVVHPDEGDLVVRQLASRAASPLAGHDPNLQFIGVMDAASALVAAAEGTATGIFNAAGPGAIPLKKAFRAAGTERIPLLKPLQGLANRKESVDQLQYNWTVSGDRALRELGFKPEQSTLEALAGFIRNKPGARPEMLSKPYDDYGLDVDYIRAWGWWFAFLRKVYWRIDSEGMENIPQAGAAMFVSNHRGFMPLDAVMHLSLAFTQRQRIIRFLIIPSLLRIPFLCNFLTKLGGVIASQESAARLFAAGELVGVFPEGIRGSFTPYRRTYTLRDFSKSAFARIAIENQTPIVPTAVIGHSEIFPIIGRIDSSYITREFGWPYLPIAPMFPLAPIPIPSKWHVRVLQPVPVSGLSPADAENAKLVCDFSRYVQSIIQTNLNDMLPKRKSIFWGKVLDGTAPDVPPFAFPAKVRVTEAGRSSHL